MKTFFPTDRGSVLCYILVAAVIVGAILIV